MCCKIIKDMPNFQIFLNLNLLELGDGWAAAVADDAEELEFFQENNRISSDDRNYWIGGLAYDTLPESKTTDI